MFLFRSLTIGLLGACVALLVRVEVAAKAPPAAAAAAPTWPAPSAVVASATIIDVAAGVSTASVSSLIRLAPDEHVVAVDDRVVDSDLAAGAAIQQHQLDARGFVDLDVASDMGAHRRVLVLLH